MSTTGAQKHSIAGQYLTFRVGSDAYAISIAKLRELVGLGGITRVPSTPPWIRGVMNLRGEVLPVIDLAVKFGLPASQDTKWTCLVVVQLPIDGQASSLGLVVDSVEDVVDLQDDEIDPPPPFGTRLRAEFVLGLARIGEGLAVLLDVDRVLTVDELLAVAEIDETGAAAPDAP